MTINGPAAIVLAMYVAAAEKRGVARGRPRRHDPERHPQGVPGAEGVHLPAAPVGAAGHRHDALHDRRDAAVAPGLDLGLPHPRGRLARPRRSWRSRWPTASPTSRRRSPRAWTSTTSRRRLSFFFNCHIDFFEEIGKFRAARRIWARWMRERYGAADERSLLLPLPHPDGRRLAHRAPARDQHRAGRPAGAGRGAGGHAEPAHRQLRRGARAAHREGRAHRPAHPADRRPRDRRGQRGRPAGRLAATSSG